MDPNSHRKIKAFMIIVMLSVAEGQYVESANRPWQSHGFLTRSSRRADTFNVGTGAHSGWPPSLRPVLRPGAGVMKRWTLDGLSTKSRFPVMATKSNLVDYPEDAQNLTTVSEPEVSGATRATRASVLRAALASHALADALHFPGPAYADAEIWSTKQLLDRIDNGSVAKVIFADRRRFELDDSRQILAIDKDGQKHMSDILPEQASDLIKVLRGKDIPFDVDEIDKGKNLAASILENTVPFYVLGAFIFASAQRGLGGLLPGSGKSSSKIQLEPQTGITFDDVAGAEGAKVELSEVVDFLKDPSRYVALGAQIPKGVIMEGPPGTGKTLLARAVAGEAGVPFISASASEFVEMYVGVGASRVRDLFGKAKQNSPCIVFIDEIDAIGRKRGGRGGNGGSAGGGGSDEREQTLNQILTEMDGFEGDTGVIVLAATNRADILDQALVRPGRFDRRVPVDLPDVKGRKEILKVHVRGKPLAPDFDLSIIAKRTVGFSGAALANLMNEAAIVAARNGKDVISYDEIDYAIDRITIGMQKSTGMMFSKRQRLVAYHEAGHAIMGLLTPDFDMVTKVTIVPRSNGAGGFTLFTPPEERLETAMYSKKYLCAQLTVALGGRVAEEIIYGKDEITTGASNDLQQVRNIARRMVAQWGFANEAMGDAPVAWEMPDGNTMMTPRTSSEATEKQIDDQVKALVSSAYDTTMKTLTQNRAFLDRLAERLVEEETLNFTQLKEMCDAYAVKAVLQA